MAGKRVVVGVDVAKKNFKATIMATERDVIATVGWTHPKQTPEFLAVPEAISPTSSAKDKVTQVEIVMEKRGSKKARKYLYFAAMRLTKSDELTGAWYEKKVQRDGGKRRKAIIAVMRKLAKALWHVGRGAKFDSSKLWDASRLEVKKEARIAA